MLHLRRTPEMVAPRALVFRPLVKGNGDPGNEIVAEATQNAVTGILKVFLIFLWPFLY